MAFHITAEERELILQRAADVAGLEGGFYVRLSPQELIDVFISSFGDIRTAREEVLKGIPPDPVEVQEDFSVERSSDPSPQQIVDDFRKGWLWLKWDLYKDSGKWAYGGWSKVAMDIAKCYRWDGVALLHEMELNQSEVQPGTFQSYRVVVDDRHMQDVPDYHDFFMRLYLVGNQG